MKKLKKEAPAAVRGGIIQRFLATAANSRRGWLTVIAGIAAGFVNGLLGAGGGVIIVRSAAHVLPHGREYSPRDVYASALAVMLPVSAVSALSYAGLGVWDGSGGIYILPALVGGVIGALLLDRLHTQLLRFIFSAVAAYSGVMMLLKK
ncbi:MAG: sulfite exporter TauE/SafE family protein [Clostridiales bacterium]|nr:sulfite exporter TauE/SafE family protein [Clostridiales bacterium]